jgi:hypothetical protein
VSAEDPVVVLERWETFGGTWRVVARAETGVTISMRRCDGGEQVQELTSRDPHLLAWLGEREDG